MIKISLTLKKQKEDEQSIAGLIEDMNLSDSDREDYHNNVDILFVLDTTSSMSPYIAKSIMTIKKIIEKFNQKEFNIKIALCTYRDHPPQDTTYVTKFTDLTSAKNIIKILSETTTQGGGDFPEAVMDGLREGIKNTSWRLGEDGETKSKRFLFHVCDAPPHGIEYSQLNENTMWADTGCPCGTKKEHIAQLLADKTVDYHLIKITNHLDQMENLFQQAFGLNFCPTIIMEGAQKYSQSDSKKKTIEKKIYSDEEKKIVESESTEMWAGVVKVLKDKLV